MDSQKQSFRPTSGSLLKYLHYRWNCWRQSYDKPLSRASFDANCAVIDAAVQQLANCEHTNLSRTCFGHDGRCSSKCLDCGEQVYRG